MALERTILVTLLTVNNQINRALHKKETVQKTELSIMLTIQVKTLTLVGIPIIIVAVEK